MAETMMGMPARAAPARRACVPRSPPRKPYSVILKTKTTKAVNMQKMHRAKLNHRT